MGVTPVYGLPYQELTDPPHGPDLGLDLATAVEAELVVLAAEVDSNVPSAAAVLASQATASAAYTDLATAGPAVTVVTGTSALVILSAYLFNSGANQSNVGFTVSGATTLAADDTRALRMTGTVGFANCVTILVSGLTAGSNIFTAKYRASAGTGTFADRRIVVIPL